MPSARDLLAQPGLGLRLVVGEQRLDDRLSWVATSEHLDPTPFLQGGELLLTTGMRLPHRADEVKAYADRLAAAGVTGLGFGLEVVHGRTPARLVRAADQAGLLLLEVDGPTPFVAVSKALSDLLAKEQYAEALRASQAQQDLTRAAVRDGAAGVVRTTARLVQGWAAVLDEEGALGEVHPATAAARASELVPELVRLGGGGPAAASLVEAGEHVSLHALVATGRVQGYFVAGLADRPGPLARSVLGVAAALLSFGLQRAEPADRRRDEALVDLACSGRVDPGALADLGGPLLRRTDLRVVVVTGPSARIDALAAELARLPGQVCLAAERGDEVVALVAEGRLPEVLALAEGHPELRVGVGDVVPPDRLPEGLAQARQAWATTTTTRRVVTLAETMSGALAVADPAASAEFAERLLHPLEQHARRTGVDLPGTVQVWLRHHGLYDPAASELGVHRHTLRNRVRRAEQLLGRPLDDPDVRMDLWFALRARRPPEP
jgi:purine catabolism regulator